MVKQVVLASGNEGKLREFAALLAGHTMKVIPQSAFNVPDVDETGLTFVENAIIKARHASECSGLPAIADDSGIEVDALKGEPGIYSARYAGVHGDDKANNRKLLDALADVPDGQRSARFQCVIVYLRHPGDPTPIICQGAWEGVILHEEKGVNGFGYDPLFWVPAENACSAELSAERKNAISHRGQALRKLVAAMALI